MRPLSNDNRIRLMRSISMALWISIWALAATSCTKNASHPGQGIEKGPEVRNLVLITIDALRSDHLGCYGYKAIPTDSIDRLADEGILYPKAISPSPWTCPAMASIFTSLYPEAHGMVLHPIMDAGEFTILSSDLTTLTETLKTSGFRTHAISEQVWVSRTFGFAQGFDVFEELKKESRALTGRALEALKDFSAQKPFFLYLHYLDPHTPYIPPEKFRIPHPDRGIYGLEDLDWDRWWKALYRLRRDTPGVDRLLPYLISLYDGEIRFVDHEVGRFLESLEAQGLAENTVVALIADHGEAFLEHAMLHGSTLFNEELAVPMIIKVPWEPRFRGVTEERLVSTVDLMPTLLHVLGIPTPVGMQGENVMPLLRPAGKGPLEEQTPKTSGYIFSESAYNRTLKKIQSRQFSLVLNQATGERLFFDLGKDPTEQNDVSSICSTEFERHLEELDRWLEEEKGWAKPGRTKVSISEEIKEQLKALGYIK